MAYAPPSIGESGLKIPTFSEILNYLIGQFRAIFGNAAYLAPDAADYQDLAVRALQAENFAQSIQALYLAFNPQTAIGRSLDLIGKLIGTPRKAASYSTAMVTLSGDPGTTVTSGVVRDVNGRYWDLASPASIGTSGTVSVLATAKIIGDVTANPGEIRTISTPTAGWTGATNPADAIPGEAVEPDSQYRARLLVAQMKPSRSLVAGTAQAIGEVLGVTRWKVYENPNGFSCGFGAVTTDGTDVALLYGYPFDATNVEQTITINGVAYTIDSVTGPDALVLTGTAGTQTGVAYSIGGGDQVGPPHSITCVVEGGVAADIAQAIYANSGIGCYRNGTTTVTVIDPDNHNAASPIRFFILAYVPVYVALDVHPLPGFTTATEAAIAAGIVSYLNSLGIGESVVFSELYGAALTARPNPDEPLFSIRAGLSGYQAASVAGDTAIGSPDVTVVSADGIVSGQVVVGTGIPDNTTVSTVVGTTVTLSANATADGSDVPLAFFTPGTTDLAVLYGQAAQGSLTYVVVNLV